MNEVVDEWKEKISEDESSGGWNQWMMEIKENLCTVKVVDGNKEKWMENMKQSGWKRETWV